MSRADDLATLGRRMAAAQGVLEERSPAAWAEYGLACEAALARRQPVPVMLASPLQTGEWSPSPSAPPSVLPTAVQSVGSAPSPTPRAAHCPSCGITLLPGMTVTPTRPGARVAAPRRRSRMARASWGILWRFAVVGALLVAAGMRLRPTAAIVAGVLAVGVVLGLWHRRNGLARLWRAVVLAGCAVYAAPLTPLYPDVLAGSLGVLSLSPILAAWRAR